METLYRSIKAYAQAAYDSGDDAAVMAALNAQVIQHTDSELKTSRWLIINRPEDAGLVLSTMKASTNPVVEAAYASLHSNGIDLSHPITQEFIDRLAAFGNWSDELKNWLKEQGVWQTSPAQDVLGRDATLQDIADVRAWEAGAEQPKTAMLSVMVQADGKVLLSYRCGDEVVSSADAANANLCEHLSHVVADLLAHMEAHG